VPGWESHGSSFTPYQSFLLKDETKIYHVEEYESFLNIYRKLQGAEEAKIEKIFAIHNPALSQSFQTFFSSMNEKFRSSNKLFKSEDWKNRYDPDQRQFLIDTFNLYRSKWDSNQNNSLSILPMLQGTAEETLWKISQTNFATIATLDKGWYGRGIYFTSSVDYATYYSKKASKNSLLSYLMLAYVIPGNIFPVIEDHDDVNDGLEGKPVINTGYQSHYVHVWPPGNSKVGRINPSQDNFVDELVVFQDAQTIPRYCIILQ